MRERTLHVLKALAASPALEARWLHTVSLLEFIGARKISRTVADRHPTREVLEHLADETRHAFAFKRLACEVAGGDAPDYLCPQEATGYFQKLDRALAAWAMERTGREDLVLHYLLTTTVIERRAMQLYPLYKAASRNPAVREELGQVVTEEQNHRVAIEQACVARLEKAGVTDGLEQALAIEAALFGELLGALEAEAARAGITDRVA
ncbi:MAG: hypothetical protein L0Y66_19315 [Myxococcaceae bacterium]|nr:hypothetical protein [Myxococcaceae bacterium]MCI0668880.1 hypothetical protein [Myxococcaceae bacterium]